MLGLPGMPGQWVAFVQSWGLEAVPDEISSPWTGEVSPCKCFYSWGLHRAVFGPLPSAPSHLCSILGMDTGILGAWTVTVAQAGAGEGSLLLEQHQGRRG